MEKKNTNTKTKDTNYDCMFYSKVLKEPFNSIEELMEAEEAYYAKLKAKEDKAAEKKADAVKVEEAFKALNAARKAYKDDLNEVTKVYSEGLVSLKAKFEESCAAIKEDLANAEATYKNALKAFTDKYPEGYHITLRDGDFETTISSQTSGSNKSMTKLSDDFLDNFINFIFSR
jgi:hypothetical protein